LVFKDSKANFISPSVVAREKETLGPNNGAITIAPITIATLLLKIPIAATIAERTTVTV